MKAIDAILAENFLEIGEVNTWCKTNLVSNSIP